LGLPLSLWQFYEFSKIETPQKLKTVLKDSSDNFRILDYPQLYLGMLVFIYVGTEVTIISNLPALLKQLNWKYFRGCYISFHSSILG
jgi:fucose permease